jgi:hypothetical protein
MKKQDRIKKQWELYKSLRGKELTLSPVSQNIPPKVNDLRELCTFPPIYFALAEEISFYQEKLFKAIVLTEEIIFGWLNSETPILKLHNFKTLLVALPFWVYLDENFLLDHTNKLGVLSSDDIHRLEDYAERARIPQDIRGKYIRFLMELLAPYNTESILTYLEKFEEYQFTPSVFTISDDLKNYYESSHFAFAKADSSKNVHKGKNFFAIVEKIPEIGPKLTLYLPQDYLGEKITIKVENKVLYEGLLETIKLEFTNLPELPDYTSWLEAIDVIDVSALLGCPTHP